MLLFKERPDEIFHAIMYEALKTMGEELKRYETNPTVINAIAPQAAPYMTTGQALEVVIELRTALDSPAVYDLTSVQRLLLADTLMRYCKSYNERPQGTEVHTRYQLRHLDCIRLSHLFLGKPSAQLASTSDQVHREATQLYMVGDPPWSEMLRKDESPWYDRASYPGPPQQNQAS